MAQLQSQLKALQDVQNALQEELLGTPHGLAMGHAEAAVTQRCAAKNYPEPCEVTTPREGLREFTQSDTARLNLNFAGRKPMDQPYYHAPRPLQELRKCKRN